jgi:hypothetical protein
MSMRFHMLSIVGIFIGLGLGILIGVSIAGDQSLLAQQQAMIDRLDADFAAMSAERAAITAELAAYKQYADESLAHIVGSSLLGRRVAVFAVGPPPSSGITSLVRACETAGGAVGAIIKYDTATLERLGEEHWFALAQAVQAGDAKLVRTLAANAAGPGSVASLTPGGCDRITIVAAEASAGQGLARAVNGLTAGLREAQGDAGGASVVVGWIGAAPEAGRQAGPHALACIQVVGVGAAPGNAAVVLALAGAEGDYGRAPATSFLPAPAAVIDSAFGGIR